MEAMAPMVGTSCTPKAYCVGRIRQGVTGVMVGIAVMEVMVAIGGTAGSMAAAGALGIAESSVAATDRFQPCGGFSKSILKSSRNIFRNLEKATCDVEGY